MDQIKGKGLKLSRPGNGIGNVSMENGFTQGPRGQIFQNLNDVTTLWLCWEVDLIREQIFPRRKEDSIRLML